MEAARQLDMLLLPPSTRASDPETSWRAADRHPVMRREDRVAVLIAHYRNPKGLTDFELGDIVKRQQTSAGKRRGELRDNGLIEQTSERRPSPSGSSAIVWRITLEGLRLGRTILESR